MPSGVKKEVLNAASFRCGIFFGKIIERRFKLEGLVVFLCGWCCGF